MQALQALEACMLILVRMPDKLTSRGVAVATPSMVHFESAKAAHASSPQIAEPHAPGGLARHFHENAKDGGQEEGLRAGPKMRIDRSGRKLPDIRYCLLSSRYPGVALSPAPAASRLPPVSRKLLLLLPRQLVVGDSFQEYGEV